MQFSRVLSILLAAVSVTAAAEHHASIPKECLACWQAPNFDACIGNSKCVGIGEDMSHYDIEKRTFIKAKEALERAPPELSDIPYGAGEPEAIDDEEHHDEPLTSTTPAEKEPTVSIPPTPKQPAETVPTPTKTTGSIPVTLTERPATCGTPIQVVPRPSNYSGTAKNNYTGSSSTPRVILGGNNGPQSGVNGSITAPKVPHTVPGSAATKNHVLGGLFGLVVLVIVL